MQQKKSKFSTTKNQKCPNRVEPLTGGTTGVPIPQNEKKKNFHPDDDFHGTFAIHPDRYHHILKTPSWPRSVRGVQRVRHSVDICGDICRDGPVPRLMPKQSRTTHGWYNVRPCSPKRNALPLLCNSFTVPDDR